MGVEDYLERTSCDTVDEFMRCLELYPKPEERRIIMSRTGLTLFLSFEELGKLEGVSGNSARLMMLFGFRRMALRDRQE